MGDFRIEINGTGGHGCNRVAQEGEALSLPVEDHDITGCPDCLAKAFVDRLAKTGVFNLRATLTHWPGQPTEVVDDLVANTRAKGHF